MAAGEKENSLEEAVRSARSGEEEGLETLIRRCVYISPRIIETGAGLGLEYDDLRQEAVIALLKALHSYGSAVGDASFRTYSAVCIRRRLASVIRSGLRQKNLPMIGYLPLDGNFPSEPGADPEAAWIEKEDSSAAVLWMLSRLSRLESAVLRLYLAGSTYEEIGGKLSISAKSAGNAMERVRQKLRSESGRR